MVSVELLIWHPPPGEVELLPGSDVGDSGRKSVMALGSVEVLLDPLSVVPVGQPA